MNTLLNQSKGKILKTGDLYWVNLAPTIGDEIQKKRPVLILNEGHEKHLNLAIVVPITSWNSAWENHPFFITLLPSGQNGLKKKSVVDCFQLRAISHKRFCGQIGVIRSDEMEQVKRAVAFILNIEFQHCD